MSIARLVLALSAVPFAGIGLAFLVAPAALGSNVDLAVATPTADNDVRAVYGGLQLACAAFLAWGALEPSRVRTVLVGQVLLFGGLAGGRVVSWAVVGWPAPLGFALHAGELVGLVCGVIALLRLGRSGGQPC